MRRFEVNDVVEMFGHIIESWFIPSGKNAAAFSVTLFRLFTARPKIDTTCCNTEPDVLGKREMMKRELMPATYGKSSTIFTLIKLLSTLLLDQYQKLADLAKSSDEWNQSTYGAFLRFIGTLLELRGYWERFL
ncbi:uncharacterized protein BT62DRAFT_993361 [Guyanagaster necrorhizus]|uniref:Uncharacterized protein n=1 Tax=Guyanagaster necrorhizus TaxID=856835 RepID=A0A9P7VUS8_9AGAR|nr:uncharacterized protein BT62DRAFT_993361 [Guyanagaster necrorhizus MCA 3950]KAG7447748.1 hypothetical protein BT62DRAFT_993361 [Guyanagaster necrorhizus MCA 3950]